MRRITRFAAGALIAAAAGALSATSARAQAPCSTARAKADSAREEVMSVLTSESEASREIRQEQGIPDPRALPTTVVRDGLTCSKLATKFGHPVGARTTFVVLQVGPLFYAREPDQRRGTGILADSTFKVIARLGVALPSDAGSKTP